MKHIFLALILISTTLLSSDIDLKKGVFGCKDINQIEKVNDKLGVSKMAAFRYMTINNCAFLKKNINHKAIDKTFLHTKLCNAKGSCYWTENKYIY